METINTIDARLAKEYEYERQDSQGKSQFHFEIKNYKMNRLQEKLITIQPISMITEPSLYIK